ncbi:MAG TPA: hypothetical protein VIJ38_04340 [Acidobacteriaceae bacterium]
MPKRDTDRLFDQIQEMADRLTEGDDAKPSSQVAGDLRQSGIDPDVLKRRFHEAAKAIASRERVAGRPAPLALQQAIEQMAPDDVMPSDNRAAEAKMSRWLDKFSSPFALPADLQAARAFRKSGEVSPSEQAELDKLEEQLKSDIRKEHDGET